MCLTKYLKIYKYCRLLLLDFYKTLFIYELTNMTKTSDYNTKIIFFVPCSF